MPPRGDNAISLHRRLGQTLGLEMLFKATRVESVLPSRRYQVNRNDTDSRLTYTHDALRRHRPEYDLPLSVESDVVSGCQMTFTMICDII